MPKYRVRNVSDVNVGRGGIVFPAKQDTDVLMEVGETRYIEIKACVRLKILGLTDRPKKERPVSHVSHEVETKVPESVTKVTEDSEIQDLKVATKKDENNDAPKTQKNDAVVDEKLEAIKTIDSSENANAGENISCPYCDFVGTKMGLYHHVRIKHPDKYEEIKVRMKSI